MILLYVPQINERITYTFSFIFEHILKIPIQFTNDSHFFAKEETVKISYSNKQIENEIHFQSSSFLFESDIKAQNINRLLEDPFAISFYLLSRYEEYLPFKEDQHQRFSYKELSLKNKIDLTEPWIDNLAYEIIKKIQIIYPSLKKGEKEFEFINSIDIDHAWKYKNKSLYKNISAISKKIILLNWKGTLEHIHVLFNYKQDPYFIYPYLKSLNLPITYFISYGRGSKWDTNHDPTIPNYKKLILELYKNPLNSLGMHPSYHSNSQFKILKKEKQQLELLLNKNIIRSRQHFIKLKLPKTYNNLITLGIKEDYSMGFQDHIGFRAGTCTPFFWFNLTENKITELKVFPFCVMDVTLKNYMQLSIEEAERVIIKLLNSVKKVNGTFISIFHNDSISDSGEWKGWKLLYEKLINKATND